MISIMKTYPRLTMLFLAVVASVVIPKRLVVRYMTYIRLFWRQKSRPAEPIVVRTPSLSDDDDEEDLPPETNKTK